jgi:hypothetical protein
VDLSTEFFVIPGMAVATRHPLRGLFRERPCPPGQTRTRGLPGLVQRHQTNRWPLMRAISVDRMSYKDASAKQTQDYRDFNHFNAPTFTTGTSIIDPGFGPASSGPKNDFV